MILQKKKESGQCQEYEALTCKSKGNLFLLYNRLCQQYQESKEMNTYLLAIIYQ